MKKFGFMSLCATFCSMMAIVVLTAGCPFNNACNGVDCDDDDPCTTDSCSGGECSNDPIDNCCETDADCDQGFCSESAGNVCVECITDENCPAGEVCDEGTCAAP